MEGTINWGVPVQRVKRTEKYDTPVITMSAIIKDGAGRKFSFNKAAVEALGLVKPTETEATYVAFGFNGEEMFCMASMDENPNGHKTNKSYAFSDKKVFEYIIKTKSLDIKVENELHLEAVEGQPVFRISKITVNDSSETVEDTTDGGGSDEKEPVKATVETIDDVIDDGPAPELAEEVVEEEVAVVEEGTGNEVFSAPGVGADDEVEDDADASTDW